MDWNRLISDKRIWGPEKQAGISPFQRDYQTVLFSSAFRRLQDKAQAFPMEQDDDIRTRLTHSLEVSAIAGELGLRVFGALREKGADPYFLERSSEDFVYILMTAGLIHDIGNPPYGHFGEYAIREWFRERFSALSFDGVPLEQQFSAAMKQDFLAFEGNAQGLRLLTRGGVREGERGLNLTMTILASVIKYPASSAEIGKTVKKMGYFQSERDVYQRIDETLGLQGERHPLSWLLEAADDIAYKLSDLEDAAVKQILSYEQLVNGLSAYGAEQGQTEALEPVIAKLRQEYDSQVESGHRKAFSQALKNWNQSCKEIYMDFAVAQFLNHYEAIMEGCYRGDLLEEMALSGAVARISEQMIYTNKVKIKAELFGRKVLRSLLDQFVPAAIGYDTAQSSGFIEQRTMDVLSHYYKSMYEMQKQGKEQWEQLYLRLLMVTDFLSGMTDHYARELYEQIC